MPTPCPLPHNSHKQGIISITIDEEKIDDQGGSVDMLSKW